VFAETTLAIVAPLPTLRPIPTVSVPEEYLKLVLSCDSAPVPAVVMVSITRSNK
jgi:hypothetical protein